jgi:hypothetical protein
MKHITFLSAALVVMALSAAPLYAQDDDRCCKKHKKASPQKKHDDGDKARKHDDGDKGRAPEPPRKPKVRKDEGGDDDRDSHRDCGLTPEQLKKILGHDGKDGKDLEEQIREHFKKFHPDGKCHCNCDHPKKGDDGEKHAKKGDDGDEHKKKPGSCDKDDEKKGDDKGGGDDSSDKGGKHKGSKGNNGVGNGQDPQPPGNPPQNDGAGTGKGNPGNKGGKKK